MENFSFNKSDANECNGSSDLKSLGWKFLNKEHWGIGKNIVYFGLFLNLLYFISEKIN